MTAASELTVIEHLHIFKQNGFEFDVPSAPAAEEADMEVSMEGTDDVTTRESTGRLKLVTLPYSNNTMFGVEGTA